MTIEIATTLGPLLLLPDGFARVVMISVLMGFPFFLVAVGIARRRR